MTQRQWHAHATAMLTAAGCEDAAFDARCLLEDLGGLPRGHAPRDTELTAEQSERLARALNERADGRPLQYILGQWDFLSLTLAVGEGVLIPRADTECLCELVARRLGDVDRPRVLDLCAGSGCVGLGIASLCDGAQVTAVELSDAALPFLRENVARYPSPCGRQTCWRHRTPLRTAGMPSCQIRRIFRAATSTLLCARCNASRAWRSTAI